MKNKLTLEQHRQIAATLQQCMGSLNAARAIILPHSTKAVSSKAFGIEKSIRKLRTDLQAELHKTYPDAGELYY